MPIALQLPAAVFHAMRLHLLPVHSRLEQGGFLFSRYVTEDGRNPFFTYVDWIPLYADDYAEQYQDYLELTDATRARIIKRAHDLDTCLMEFHSHPGPYPAAFSPSDMHGFGEFVPHVRWRLKGKQYAAVVIAPSGFDALAWVDKVGTAVQLHTIETDIEILHATALTLRCRQKVHHGAI